jgi:hypothetical protein
VSGIMEDKSFMTASFMEISELCGYFFSRRQYVQKKQTFGLFDMDST